ncbi:helix-turn-helix domain-containing protein [Amycolatopsis sp. WGS_07]|uniref:helix-turn-helix domain-containing protein n=1 Tax=Amycolatopsis sp. WGS_07 TaxID=3076764 RepID=UPI0038731396
MAPPPRTPRAVIGGNLRRIREELGMTQHETARHLALCGLMWSRQKLSAAEQGLRPIEIEDLILLAIAFNTPLTEFLKGAGHVEVGAVSLELRLIQQVLRGEHFRSELSTLGPTERLRELTRAINLKGKIDSALHPEAVEADFDLARKLGVPLEAVTSTAYSIWDRTLTEERDAQAVAFSDLPIRQRQAQRGHVTRALTQQLESELRRRSLLDDGKE